MRDFTLSTRSRPSTCTSSIKSWRAIGDPSPRPAHLNRRMGHVNFSVPSLELPFTALFCLEVLHGASKEFTNCGRPSESSNRFHHPKRLHTSVQFGSHHRGGEKFGRHCRA